MKTVIFDLDGTLLNTLEDLKNAVNYALKIRNLPEKDLDFIRKAIGNGTQVLIKRSTPCDISDEEREAVFNDFRRYYLSHFDVFTKPYEGIKELLIKLKNKGIKLALVSNKDDDLTNKLISKEFPNLIDIIQGSYLDKPKKPDPYLVSKIVNENKLDKKDILYVGDTNVDRETAVNSNLNYVLVNYGFRSKEELKKTCPDDESIDSVDELYHYIMKWVNL